MSAVKLKLSIINIVTGFFIRYIYRYHSPEFSSYWLFSVFLGSAKFFSIKPSSITNDTKYPRKQLSVPTTYILSQ